MKRGVSGSLLHSANYRSEDQDEAKYSPCFNKKKMRKKEAEKYIGEKKQNNKKLMLSFV